MHVHKNDTALVVAGNARGRSGKVLKVYPETGRVIIEGVNIIKRHTRPSQKNPQGGIVQKEAPVNGTNVMVVCPKCNTASRVGHAHVPDASTGRRRAMRICRSCGEMF